MTVADRRAIVIREQTQPVQVTLQISHGQLSFRVVFVTLPGTDDVVVIGVKTLEEKLHIVGGKSVDGASGRFTRAERRTREQRWY